MPHWRLVLSALGGLAGFGLAGAFGASQTLAALIGWNTGAGLFLAMVWTLFLTASESQVRERAARQDERRGVILAVVLVAVAASLAAIVWALLSVKQAPPAQRGAVTILAVVTLVASWAVLQSIFALHYAHEHFFDIASRAVGGGIVFPGDPARTYLDFIYLSVCVGATGQVSDPNVTSTRLRNLVTAHGVTAFFYNTAVLALGINILASLLSG